MFIINPDKYLLPAYRISPFRTSDIERNHYLSDTRQIDDYFSERFNGLSYNYTINGREAINLALQYLNLHQGDSVTIFTTSGNDYISSCVTSEIEKFCKWSRRIIPETKAIFVNHEFGYPYPNLKRLKDMNLPIIEDCAGAFFSADKDNTIGKTGDFVIYSFPKMFPIQIGGLVVSRFDNKCINPRKLESGMLRYIRNVLSVCIKEKEQIIRQRIRNYNELRHRFESLDLPERFELVDGIVPGVFMFRTGSYNINLPELKEHFWAHGIQSSVFYGETAFFIPVHQALNAYDIEYFYEVMKAFLQKVDE